ncbi:hypothetical protein IWW55_004371, partial [Coemansia sp. RSA 2706]
MRAMLLQAGAPESMWPYTLDHAVHIYNSLPHSALRMESPVQQLNIEIPLIPQYPFGCLAEVSIPRHMRS